MSCNHITKLSLAFLPMLIMVGCQPVTSDGVKNTTAAESSTIKASPPLSEKNKPKQHLASYKTIMFVCENGQKFAIRFMKNKKIAHLALSGSSETEILRENRIGDGASYRNEKFIFEDHGGVITFDTKKTETTCHVSLSTTNQKIK